MTNPLKDFLNSLESPQHSIAATLAFIDNHYLYQPQAFTNGSVQNSADENQRSCKILGLALLEGLSNQQVLLAFGEFYRQVLATPDGNDHANIRQLMQTGLEQVSFDNPPLRRRTTA